MKLDTKSVLVVALLLAVEFSALSGFHFYPIHYPRPNRRLESIPDQNKDTSDTTSERSPPLDNTELPVTTVTEDEVTELVIEAPGLSTTDYDDEIYDDNDYGELDLALEAPNSETFDLTTPLSPTEANSLPTKPSNNDKLEEELESDGTVKTITWISFGIAIFCLLIVIYTICWIRCKFFGCFQIPDEEYEVNSLYHEPYFPTLVPSQSPTISLANTYSTDSMQDASLDIRSEQEFIYEPPKVTEL